MLFDLVSVDKKNSFPFIEMTREKKKASKKDNVIVVYVTVRIKMKPFLAEKKNLFIHAVKLPCSVHITKSKAELSF